VSEGRYLTSSEELAAVVGVHPAQVRKDLGLVAQGRAGVGYNTRQLLRQLEDLLGLNNATEAIIVGAGNLGLALARYPGFAHYGLSIAALCDADPAKVGREVEGKPVLPIAKLAPLARRLDVRMGIICVPAAAAQAVADEMVAAGIIAIWNFAPTPLKVPPDVMVRNEDLAAQLAILSFFVQRRAAQEGEEQDAEHAPPYIVQRRSGI
jgi:redox-sensing transcriptional repressor